MLRKALIAACIFLILCGASLLAARVVVGRAARGRTYTDVSLIPHRHVGLVLGCPKRLFGGWSNPFFENRMAAAQLYQSGKVDYRVVSGDNHIQTYDEPLDMRNTLVEMGVPKDRIYLDYAGLRTLDSVVRVKQIFLQETSPSFPSTSTTSGPFSWPAIMESTPSASMRWTWPRNTRSRRWCASSLPRSKRCWMCMCCTRSRTSSGGGLRSAALNPEKPKNHICAGDPTAQTRIYKQELHFTRRGFA